MSHGGRSCASSRSSRPVWSGRCLPVMGLESFCEAAPSTCTRSIHAALCLGGSTATCTSFAGSERSAWGIIPMVLCEQGTDTPRSDLTIHQIKLRARCQTGADSDRNVDQWSGALTARGVALRPDAGRADRGRVLRPVAGRDPGCVTTPPWFAAFILNTGTGVTTTFRIASMREPESQAVRGRHSSCDMSFAVDIGRPLDVGGRPTITVAESGRSPREDAGLSEDVAGGSCTGSSSPKIRSGRSAEFGRAEPGRPVEGRAELGRDATSVMTSSTWARSSPFLCASLHQCQKVRYS